MPTFSLTPLLSDAPRVRVFRRVGWSGSWTEEPYLRVDSFDECAGPTISHAQLTWRYGELLQAGQLQFAEYLEKSLVGAKLKIVCDNPVSDEPALDAHRWYGIVIDNQNALSGAPASVENPLANIWSGRQSIVAVGLEWLLDREFIRHSWALVDSVPTRIARGLAFNEPNPHKPDSQRGNRSASLGPDGVYLFTDDLDNAASWSSAQILAYLLQYHAPTDPSGAQLVPWQLAGLGHVYQHDRPYVPTHNRSVKSLVDQLLDRRRLVGYTVRADETVTAGDEEAGTLNHVELAAFSFNAAELTVGSETLDAHPRQRSLDVASSPAVIRCTLRESAADRYDQVVILGGRMVGCFSISADDATLVKLWTTAEQTAYEAAATGEGGYGSLDLWEKQMRNDIFRHDLRYTRVFRYFGLPQAWNGLVRNGQGSGVERPWFPSDADPDEPLAVYRPGARFERLLPLKTNHDYTANRIAEGTVLNNSPPGEPAENLPMIVLMALPHAGETYGARYVHLDRFGLMADNELSARFAASVRAQEDGPGLVIDMQDAGKQQVIAIGDFTPNADDISTSELVKKWGAVDWRENLIATVALRTDDHAAGVFPATIPGFDDAAQRLVIDAGEQFQTHYVAPNTIVGTADGGLLRSASGGYLRDDRPQLLSLARFAYLWYDELRRALSLALKQVTFDLQIGDLITTLDGRQVGTCVTRLRWVFDEQAVGPTGSPPPGPRTEIETAFAALDVRAVIGMQ